MIAIDGYTNVDRIGLGGLGDVYRATAAATGVTVAIKVLRDVSDESVAWHRTRREFAALEALAGHPHVIQLIELIELEQGPGLVMEYAPGGSVADAMRTRDSTLSVAEAVRIGRDTAAALASAHEQGIVHRDIKPQNLLFDADGRVKLCDFGIATLTHSENFRARTDALSLRYAAPEDLDNEVEVGPACDVYSLGATLLHIARGAPPTLRERIAGWVPPVGTHTDVAALDALIAACLHPDPRQRPTAAKVLADLDTECYSRCQTPAVTIPVADDCSGDLTADPPLRIRFDEPVDEPTVHRPAETAPVAVALPLPARPAAPASRVWHRPIAAGLVGVGALLALVFSLGRGSDQAATVQQVALIDRPSDLPKIIEATWPIGNGDTCLVQIADSEALVPVTCELPHDLQRFATAELDHTDYPPETEFDSEQIAETIESICARLFEQFVGGSYRSSRFQISITRPSAATWPTGDRRFQCLLGVLGRRVTGDARNSAW